MIGEISLILLLFEECFSRRASFHWFVVVIMGFIMRLDHHGVSSIIRWLGIKPSHYPALLSFFRASSWRLSAIQKRWYEIVFSRCPLLMVAGRCLIAGDGIKISKEARKMPGVKRLHQESDNSGKAPYIYGHHFGVLGILTGWAKKNSSVSPFAPSFMKGPSSCESFSINRRRRLIPRAKSVSPP